VIEVDDRARALAFWTQTIGFESNRTLVTVRSAGSKCNRPTKR
jgi:hypothetical protein